MNPLLRPYNTPFKTIPFTEITLEHFLPAFKEAIEMAIAEIVSITSNSESPSFENTIEALEKSGEALDRVSSVFFNLNSAETNEELQALAQEASPLLSKHGNDVILNASLFKRVQSVQQVANTDLPEEQKTLLHNTYRSFVRNGALLASEQKEILRKIDSDLATRSLTFGENVLKESNAFTMVLDEEQDLDGLPLGIIEEASERAKQDGLENAWIFTLDYPSYIPFMTYSSCRALRKKMHMAFGSKAFQSNDYNNESVIKELVVLREKRAQLLGYESHAHFVLEERMAVSPSKVLSFLNNLQDEALPFAKKEFEALQAFAVELDGLDALQKWDSAFYAEKLKKQKFEIDDEALRPYFKLENVIYGVFETAKKLFGLQFNRLNNIAVYHPEVEVYEVLDSANNHLAIFYADFFPRPGKRQGAWMTSFRAQKIINGKDQRPHVSIVCNFTKPSTSKPSLLTFNEVTTLFHEFGHALHGIMANGHYGSLSGTSVYWDFVELPSQILENWCYEKECLDLFARHYKTGEAIPEEFIERIKSSANFMSGMATIRQIGLAKIDMSWHSKGVNQIRDVKGHEHEILKELDFFPEVAETCTSTSFSHIFQGGYSSGYYSYKWAEVLDADAFEAFKENGIFDKKTAESFAKNILSAGGSEHPSILYKRFRGRDANPDALLKRAGLTDSKSTA